ncbi:tRNA methyltransferase tyw3 [Mortierella sp. AD032]|nr:tRNA methyltransferase tyw3 [Mortierella sp. AD032]
MSTSTTTTATSIPVLLAPGHLTKHLKVFLDKAGWRDRAKLITRYSQIILTASSDQPTVTRNTTTTVGQDTHKDEIKQHDLSQYMAMALLPVGPFISAHTNINDHAAQSLWDLTQQGQTSQPSSLSSIDWPAPLSDATLQKTIYLVHLNPTHFPMPKHLLAQTPLEKLQQSTADFLLPYLQSWANDGNDHQDHTQQEQGRREQKLTPHVLPDLIASLPQKWEHYSDFTFLPPTAFLTAPWPAVLKRLVTLDLKEQSTTTTAEAAAGGRCGGDGIMARWEKLVQDALGSSHIARKAIIPVQDILRRPKIRPLAGDWKLHNRYKSWIEEDGGEEGLEEATSNLLEHQEMSSGLSSSKADNTFSSSGTARVGAGTGAESTGLYESTSHSTSTSPSTDNSDVLPTPQNFSQTYWSETCQNKVWYTWSPMFTMFSAGNISEKERVAQSRPLFDARGKIVVDLYAGIGYFALVYLIHSGAKTVHACEWNPWSVEGLVRGAERNEVQWKRYHGENVRFRVKDKEDEVVSELQQQQPFTTGQPTPRRPPPTNTTTTTKKQQKQYGQLVVYPGDNAQWIEYFENTAHHVNLGLIPSAEPGWVLGVRALCPQEGGYLHVHHNIRVGEEKTFQAYLLQSLRDLFATWKGDKGEWSVEIRHVENVKSFAPLVFHYVLDVECRPSLPSLISL